MVNPVQIDILRAKLLDPNTNEAEMRLVRKRIHTLSIQLMQQQIQTLKASIYTERVAALKDQLQDELADCQRHLTHLRGQLEEIQSTAGEGEIEDRASHSAEGDSLRAAYAACCKRCANIQAKLEQLVCHPELAFVCTTCNAGIEERVSARPESKRCTNCKAIGNGNGASKKTDGRYVVVVFRFGQR